ncbi:MAG: hypothetical protein SGI90_14540 [Candidatus Eisenbacteria bacterium]|nr:hypothetical protein [Candidatus Eisenbacteria bacterium]
MRTTVEINDELFRLAKKHALEKGIPLREVIESALRAYLGARPRTAPYRFEWHTEGGGVRPGIDLSDWSTVRRAMGDDDPRDEGQ